VHFQHATIDFATLWATHSYTHQSEKEVQGRRLIGDEWFTQKVPDVLRNLACFIHVAIESIRTLLATEELRRTPTVVDELPLFIG
jgi:hypothetical protein